MKVNFKSFKDKTEVERFLESHLQIGTASPEEVAAFLRDLGLEPSALHKNAGLPSDVSPSKFDAMITSMTLARPTLFILENVWWMMFLFAENTLVRVVVQKSSIGL